MIIQNCLEEHLHALIQSMLSILVCLCSQNLSSCFLFAVDNFCLRMNADISCVFCKQQC